MLPVVGLDADRHQTRAADGDKGGQILVATEPNRSSRREERFDGEEHAAVCDLSPERMAEVCAALDAATEC
jgi:hypothetical protein